MENLANTQSVLDKISDVRIAYESYKSESAFGIISDVLESKEWCSKLYNLTEPESETPYSIVHNGFGLFQVVPFDVNIDTFTILTFNSYDDAQLFLVVYQPIINDAKTLLA